VRFCCAEASAVLAEARFWRAWEAFIVASFSPAVTLSPTATLTAVSVPLVEKLSEVVVDEATFAEAVWTDCTVPRATVAVCVTEAELPEVANTESRPKPTARATITTIPA
jgi:hypothetical protein